MKTPPPVERLQFSATRSGNGTHWITSVAQRAKIRGTEVDSALARILHAQILAGIKELLARIEARRRADEKHAAASQSGRGKANKTGALRSDVYI